MSDTTPIMLQLDSHVKEGEDEQATLFRQSLQGILNAYTTGNDPLAIAFRTFVFVGFMRHAWANKDCPMKGYTVYAFSASGILTGTVDLSKARTMEEVLELEVEMSDHTKQRFGDTWGSISKISRQCSMYRMYQYLTLPEFASSAVPLPARHEAEEIRPGPAVIQAPEAVRNKECRLILAHLV